MLVANYSSGYAAVIPVHEDGTLGDQVHVFALQGPGAASKVQILPSHSNTVVSWRIDSGTESLTPTGQVVRNLSTITIAFATGADQT
jgi:hypothetical protein